MLSPSSQENLKLANTMYALDIHLFSESSARIIQDSKFLQDTTPKLPDVEIHNR